MRKGEIVLIPFPFTDLSGQKVRPALSLYADQDVAILAFITTQLRWRQEFDVVIEPSRVVGLKKKSLIRLNKIASLSRGLVLGKLGMLPEKDLFQVEANLMELLGL